MDSKGIIEIGLGAVLLVLAGVIVFTVLPVINTSIATYAKGPDGILSTTATDTDDPPSSQIQLANLFPLTVIAALVVGGVVFLIAGFRHVSS